MHPMTFLYTGLTRLKTLRSPLLVWIGVMFLSLLLSPHDGFQKLFYRCGEFFDAGHYTTIATAGYTSEGVGAFYPLWPILLKIMTFGSTDRLIVGVVGSLVSAALFLIVLSALVQWAQDQKLNMYRSLVFYLLILSPLSLFRVLNFTESLFSVCLVLMVLELNRKTPSLIRIAFISALLASVRPMLPFIVISGMLIAVMNYFRNRHEQVHSMRPDLARAVSMSLGAIFGYLPFGLYSQSRFQNFWHPFDVQKLWDRKFGLYWDLIFSPKVINGSNEVLVWDLVAFYLPLILFGWGAYYFVLKKRNISDGLFRAFCFCVLIGCAHAGSAFLTFGRFMSTGRHVLSNPLQFMALLIAVQYVGLAFQPLVTKVLKFVVFVSFIFLGMWWFRYANDMWIG